MYATLTQCPLFQGLTQDTIREMIAQGNYTLTDYKDGDKIADRDTAYSGLMIIVEGKVHGEMTDPSGKTVMIDKIEAPQLIAPAFLFGGYNKLPIDVIADGSVRILTLHRGYLFELMQNNVVVLSNFIDIISNRANLWSKKIFFLSFRSLQAKVATYLLENTSDSKASLPMPDTAEIASYFDATRPAVDTVLQEMEKKKLIGREKNQLTILNRAGLQAVVQHA